jgi:hypothetical protein
MLLGGYAEDVPQLTIHPIHPVGGECEQVSKSATTVDTFLAGPGKGWTRHPLTIDGSSDSPVPSSSLGEVDGCGPLHP